MKKNITIILITICVIPTLLGVALSANLETGYGWHVDGTEKQAIEKSVFMMKKTVSDPGLVVLYSTVGYDTNIVMKELRKQIGKKSQIFGLTSCWGVITSDGVHTGEKASLVSRPKSFDIIFGNLNFYAAIPISCSV
jgi:hypothetical protein